MAEHTPGPWTSCPNKHCYREFHKARINLYSPSGGWVASVIPHTHSDVMQANARLIAAAPKMLLAIPDPEKLALLANWIDQKYPNDSNPEVQASLRKWATLGREALEAVETTTVP